MCNRSMNVRRIIYVARKYQTVVWVTIFVDDTFFSCSNHCPRGLTHGLIAEYAETRCTRECASRRAGTNTLTWKSKHLCASFADASSPASAHRCVPLRNARELCSRCAALFTRWLAARSYVFEYYVSHSIHRSKVYRRIYTLDIDQSGIIRAKRISADTTLATAFIPGRNYPPFILPSIGEKKKVGIGAKHSRIVRNNRFVHAFPQFDVFR